MHNIVTIPILYGLIDDVFVILVLHYEYDYIYYILASVKVPRQGNSIAMVCFLHHLMSSFYITKLLNCFDVMQNTIYNLQLTNLVGKALNQVMYASK